jgi:hypothetical protein
MGTRRWERAGGNAQPHFGPRRPGVDEAAIAGPTWSGRRPPGDSDHGSPGTPLDYLPTPYGCPIRLCVITISSEGCVYHYMTRPLATLRSIYGGLWLWSGLQVRVPAGRHLQVRRQVAPRPSGPTFSRLF